MAYWLEQQGCDVSYCSNSDMIRPNRGPDKGYLIGARNSSPINGGGDWICVKPEHWIFAGTGMKKGDRLPGLIGWEYHGDPPTDLPGLEVVAQGTAFQGGVNPSPWTATNYPGPKGNYVFNAATIVRLTFSFNAATTRGKPTMAGPTSRPFTRTPKTSRAPGPM